MPENHGLSGSSMFKLHGEAVRTTQRHVVANQRVDPNSLEFLDLFNTPGKKRKNIIQTKDGLYTLYSGNRNQITWKTNPGISSVSTSHTTPWLTVSCLTAASDDDMAARAGLTMRMPLGLFFLVGPGDGFFSHSGWFQTL